MFSDDFKENTMDSILIQDNFILFKKMMNNKEVKIKHNELFEFLDMVLYYDFKFDSYSNLNFNEINFCDKDYIIIKLLIDIIVDFYKDEDKKNLINIICKTINNRNILFTLLEKNFHKKLIFDIIDVFNDDNYLSDAIKIEKGVCDKKRNQRYY